MSTSPPPLPPDPVQPHSRAELERAWRRPHRLVDVVLGEPERLAAGAQQDGHPGALLGVLLLASTAFAVPYGCVIGWQASWKVATLYLGSTLLCVPALHVFAAYLGARARPAQNLVLALAVPAVAALFTCGFAPILGFLRLTMGESGSAVRWEGLSLMLLAASLLAGIGQLWRCLARMRGIAASGSFPIVLLGWHVVFLYVMQRMATVLGFL